MRTWANAIVSAAVVTLLGAASLNIPGCRGCEQQVDKAIDKAKEEAERMAREAPEKAWQAAKDALNDAGDKLTKEPCPICKQPAEPRSEAKRHQWWFCGVCNVEFATYAGNNPGHPDTYKGYCTWYAYDRWLYDGNAPQPAFLRNATGWYDNVPEDMRTQTPSPGCVVVFGPKGKNPAGHVAYVEAVDDTSYTIWQMNAGPHARFIEGLETNYFKRVTKETFLRKSTETKYGHLKGFLKPFEPGASQP